MRKALLILITLVIGVLSGSVLPPKSSAHTISGEPPGFDHTLLISDTVFLNSATMDGTNINRFLESKGSWLTNYTIPEYFDVPYFCKNDAGNVETRYATGVRQWHVDNFALYGMTAATLLAARAQANGVNPQVMIALLERESSSISQSTPSSDFRRAWPLFYGFDETLAAGNDPCSVAEQKARDYGGVGQQLAYGTFGIKNNYNNSSDWQNAITIDGVTFTCKSRATRALYRYTPHIHTGNHNFWYFMSVWFPTYSAFWVSQSAATSASNAYFPTLAPGFSTKLTVNIKNIGSATWQRGVVNLGTDRSRDRVPGFIREDREKGSPSGWLKENRVEMKQASVAPGETATFEFWYTAPDNMAPGTYREYFRPVADGITWMDDWGIYWDVKVISKADSYRARWYTQDVNSITLARGEKRQFEVKFENTGISTWTRGTVNLGTDRPRDRIPGFLREGGSPSGWLNHDRIEMVEASVPPGGVGTFRFWYTVTSDKAPGVYKEYFRPVADFIGWMDDYGVYFEITVP
jgi:hypothetical protein